MKPLLRASLVGLVQSSDPTSIFPITNTVRGGSASRSDSIAKRQISIGEKFPLLPNESVAESDARWLRFLSSHKLAKDKRR